MGVALSAGALNILTYMIWISRDSKANARLCTHHNLCGTSTHVRSGKFSSYESALLTTYFSLDASQDSIVLEARQAVARSVHEIHTIPVASDADRGGPFG